MIGDRGPAEIDRRGGNGLFHGRWPFVRHRLSNHRRGNNNSVPPHLWPRRFGGNVDIDVSFESITLHGLATDRAQLVIARPFVNDRCVVVSYVGDIGRLIDNRHVAFRR